MDCEMNTTMWFQPGWCRNDTAVVLECPGKEEMLANRPAVGKTGKNLCCLLCDLRIANIKDLCKRTIEIINASRIPHYKGALDGAKIKDKEVEMNIEFAKSRLMRNEITHILCFGKYAEMLFNKIQKDHSYAQNPPEGCDVIEDTLMVYKGLRMGKDVITGQTVSAIWVYVKGD